MIYILLVNLDDQTVQLFVVSGAHRASIDFQLLYLVESKELQPVSSLCHLTFIFALAWVNIHDGMGVFANILQFGCGIMSFRVLECCSIVFIERETIVHILGGWREPHDERIELCRSRAAVVGLHR